MNIQKLIENLRLISGVIPDYAEGRSRGLTDEETEMLALEAVSEAIELLENNSKKGGTSNMSKGKTPCYECKDRVIGCHSTCLKYKSFLQKHEKVRLSRKFGRVVKEEKNENKRGI